MPPCLVDLHGRFRAIRSGRQGDRPRGPRGGACFPLWVIRARLDDRSEPAPRPEHNPSGPTFWCRQADPTIPQRAWATRAGSPWNIRLSDLRDDAVCRDAEARPSQRPVSQNPLQNCLVLIRTSPDERYDAPTSDPANDEFFLVMVTGRIAGPVKAGRAFRGHPKGLALIGRSTGQDYPRLPR